MATLIEKLTAEGQGEPAAFLNDIITYLWPNIQVAGSQIIKDTVEPMFKTMLPGPLTDLHFTKIDFGSVPIVFSNVVVVKTPQDGIQLDLNVDWEGKCHFSLDGKMAPKVGVKKVVLNGRLSILLCPLTNIIPLIGAAQIAFINPPQLKLNFTGAADVADFSFIEAPVRKILLSIINSILVLPNRIMVRLDSTADYFKTFHQPLGIIRITAEKASGFAEEQEQSKAKKLFSKLTRASPDCYAEIEVGAEPAWRTSTKNNTTTPTWGETHDFVVTDYAQCVKVTVNDQDVNSDDEVGVAVTTVREILVAGGKMELGMIHKGEETPGKVALSCEFFQFTPEDGASFSASTHSGPGLMSGLISVLIAGAFGIKGPRETLQPSIVVTYGDKHRFQTAIHTDAPGTDINNPAFDTQFRIPVTGDITPGSLRIACMDKEKEVGAIELPFADLAKAPNMTLTDNFDVGNGAKVRASIILSGLKHTSAQEMTLPQR